MLGTATVAVNMITATTKEYTTDTTKLAHIEDQKFVCLLTILSIGSKISSRLAFSRFHFAYFLKEHLTAQRKN